MSKKITILGAGNGGHALCFHLASSGCDVMLFEHPAFKKNLGGINERGGIEAVDYIEKDGSKFPGKLTGFAKVAATTTDIKEAMSYSDKIMMIVPSFAQEIMFELAMPHLRDGMIFMILPGNFSSLVFKKMMKDKGIHKKVTFVESNTIPDAVRIVGPGKIFIGGVKHAFDIAAMPTKDIDRAMEIFQKILPLDLIPLSNVLECGLTNMNIVAHVPTTVLNMGLAESRKGQFYFYKEGMSESISRVQEKLDEERIAIGNALGVDLEPFCSLVKTFYHFDCNSIRDFALRTPVHNSFGYDFPKSPGERYITEDCPFILVPMHELAELENIPHPVIKSLITIASIYNDTDYFKEGRILSKMGITGMNKEHLIKHIDEHRGGFWSREAVVHES